MARTQLDEGQRRSLALRALAAEYDLHNQELFGGLLKRPALSLHESTTQLGLWLAEPPEIRVSRHVVMQRPWPVAVEVLKHEMAHQFVCQVLRIDEAPHGKAFVGVCRERGIDAAATGVRSPTAATQGGVLQKVMRLLSLAQSENVHEAEAAMAAAQRLMLKHNLQRETVQGASPYEIRYLGAPSGRVPEHERIISGLLGEFFFVEVLWVQVWRVDTGRTGSLLEICGTPENVELAEYVYDFLVRAAGRLWEAHRVAHRIPGNRDRRRFLAGVMNGFYKKLQGQQKRSEQDGLVWMGDPKLEGYFRKRHPRIQSIGYGGRPADAAFLAGRDAGQELVLHRGMESRVRNNGRLLSS